MSSLRWTGRTGATAEEVSQAKEVIAQIIDSATTALAELPRDASPGTKLRAIHKVVHDKLGWGVESENNFSRGLANKQPDCDIFSLVFVEVGAAVGMPMRMVLTARDDGHNHAFVTYGEGDSFRAIETRANPAKRSQIIFLAETELVGQFEAGSGLVRYSSPIFVVDAKSFRAFHEFELRGVFPKDIEGAQAKYVGILGKGCNMSLEELGQSTEAASKLCARALESGTLTPDEQATLKKIIEYRDALVAELEKSFPDHPMALGWKLGPKRAIARYLEVSRELLERGTREKRRIDTAQEYTDRMNGDLKKLALPFKVVRGGYDHEGQCVDEVSQTFIAEKAKKSISVGGITGVNNGKLNDGTHVLIISFRDSPTSPERKVYFTEKGDYEVKD